MTWTDDKRVVDEAQQGDWAGSWSGWDRLPEDYWVLTSEAGQQGWNAYRVEIGGAAAVVPGGSTYARDYYEAGIVQHPRTSGGAW